MLGARLYFIQVQQAEAYKERAQANHQVAKESMFRRGKIFMQDKSGQQVPLATNKKWFSVYAVPSKIEKQAVDRVVGSLSGKLEVEESVLRKRLSKENDPYEPLTDRLSSQEANAIKSSTDHPGIKLTSSWGRFYPMEQLSARAVGFVGFEGDERAGQYGIEAAWDKTLGGEASLQNRVNAVDNIVGWTKRSLGGVQSGSDVILSLDPNISTQAREILQELVDKWDANGGQIIVTDPETGFVKAMVAVPGFNPNQYGEFASNMFLSPFHQLTFEPGSIFKAFTFAAALDSGAVTPQEKFTDTGEVKIGPEVIENYDGEARGTVTMTEVLEQSLNTGAIYAMRQVGQNLFKDYISQLRFGQKTGIRLPGEVSGDISNLDSGRPVNYATASFGQGVSVTQMQLVQAMGAVANGGNIYRPQLVRQVVHPDGGAEKFSPQRKEKVLSREATNRLTSMLVSVVENGKKARVKGYHVAGKTGTAQVASQNKPGYSADENIHTFIGYAPAYDPAFLALIKLDDPSGVRFAAQSVTPAFSDLAEFILNYYQIPPTKD